MKNQKTITDFECDFCGNKIKDVSSEDGFPYQHGWVYLYNLQVKLEKATKLPTEEDKHFCSKDCLVNYVKHILEEPKKETKKKKK